MGIDTIGGMFDKGSLTGLPDQRVGSRYPGRVPRSAADIAAEIRQRSPGIGVKKLHKLLYYCQGHHLARVGRRLFSETVSAWDMGPVVGQLWKAEKDRGISAARPVDFDEGELNTIGYVLSRYGRLSAVDLEHLTHGEKPWRRANLDRPPGSSVPIRPEWIRTYFRTEDESDDDGPVFDAETMRRFVEGAERRLREPATPDTVEGIRARARSHG